MSDARRSFPPFPVIDVLDSPVVSRAEYDADEWQWEEARRLAATTLASMCVHARVRAAVLGTDVLPPTLAALRSQDTKLRTAALSLIAHLVTQPPQREASQGGPDSPGVQPRMKSRRLIVDEANIGVQLVERKKPTRTPSGDAERGTAAPPITFAAFVKFGADLNLSGASVDAAAPATPAAPSPQLSADTWEAFCVQLVDTGVASGVLALL